MTPLAPLAEPFTRFIELLSAAKAVGEERLPEPTAFALGTVGDDGQPSVRIVLLKAVDERGFVFYTNYESRKGREILGNPKVSLSFYWRQLDKQVVVLGTAERVSDEEADAYFASRPRGSQLGAWVSQQSRPLPSRAQLVAEVARLEAHYLGRAIPRPSFWSGFRVVPHWIEFWISGAFRLHDRTVYERVPEGWRVTKRYP